MTWDRDEVLGFEDRRLFQDTAPHLGECQTMLAGPISLEPAGLLYGLKGYAANAWLLECELDDGAELRRRSRRARRSPRT